MTRFVVVLFLLISIMIGTGCVGQNHGVLMDLNPNDSVNYKYNTVQPIGLTLNILNEGTYNITITTDTSSDDVVLFEQANYEYVTSDKFGTLTYHKYYVDEDYIKEFLFGKPICESNSQYDCHKIYETPRMYQTLNVTSHLIKLKLIGNGVRKYYYNEDIMTEQKDERIGIVGLIIVNLILGLFAGLIIIAQHWR